MPLSSPPLVSLPLVSLPLEDGGPLQTFALENSLMSENAFCQMMGTKDEFETRTESKEPNVLKSMASGLEILGEGFANFGLIDNDGKPTKRSISDKEMELKKSRGGSSKSDQPRTYFMVKRFLWIMMPSGR